MDKQYTAEQIVQKFSDVKTLPHVALRITQLVNSENATMQDFEEIIKLDPILVSRLLKLVNSPYFGLVNKVDSISKAVVYSGMKNLRNLVAVEALREFFLSDDSADEIFSRRKLWIHSATVAILAEMIAKRIFGLPGEDFFLAGIIHDLGFVAEDQVAPAQTRKACAQYAVSRRPLSDCEEEFIGTNHSKVGALLSSDWKLPDGVLKAIKYHHDNQRKNPVDSPTAILQIAEYFAGKMQYGVVSGRLDPLPSHLTRHVKNMVPNYKIIVRDAPGEMAKARELYTPEK